MGSYTKIGLSHEMGLNDTALLWSLPKNAFSFEESGPDEMLLKEVAYFREV